MNVCVSLKCLMNVYLCGICTYKVFNACTVNFLSLHNVL